MALLFTSSIFEAKDMTFERKSEGINCENATGLSVLVLETIVCLSIEIKLTLGFLASRAQQDVCWILYEAHLSFLQGLEQIEGIAGLFARILPAPNQLYFKTVCGLV